jgi:hypothetical protein
MAQGRQHRINRRDGPRGIAFIKREHAGNAAHD